MRLPSLFRRADPATGRGQICLPDPSPDRVTAFCDWLEQQAPGAPFHLHPDYRLRFGDLTMAEIDRAIVEMQERERA